MNIFALSDDPRLAAVWQHDKHVVKMTLETAQLLSQAVRLNPAWAKTLRYQFDGFYKTTHRHHPSSKWCRASLANFRWLCLHGLALAEEYTHRFGKTHKSQQVICQALSSSALFPADDIGLTPFAVAMPDEYKVEGDPVASYRLYYREAKVHADSKWTNRCRVGDLPRWLSEAAL